MSGITQRLQIMVEKLEGIKTPLSFMEVCGTHTMSAFRSGLRSILPSGITLLSGPGCPVCVTPSGYVEQAVLLSERKDVVITTFGDLLRVPGQTGSLEKARARGGDIRVVYSPLDALALAEKEKEKEVVFLGVGFETTAPAIAGTIKHAVKKNISNFSVFTAHKTMPQAMTALLKDQDVKVDGFLCPGHVSVIIGWNAYRDICQDYAIPCVVSGFEPEDMIVAIEKMIDQIKQGKALVENAYGRSVEAKGNLAAQDLLKDVFRPCDATWRGLGVIAGSGLRISEDYLLFDSQKKFGLSESLDIAEPAGCQCGDVLRGVKRPVDCPLYKKVCTPENPIGACMVSSEGTCAAYYKYAQ